LPGTDWGACDNVKKPDKTMLAQVIVLSSQGSSRQLYSQIGQSGLRGRIADDLAARRKDLAARRKVPTRQVAVNLSIYYFEI
jgi:hypothetical protein